MTTLKNVLVVNAISSGATGLLLTLMPNAVAGIFEVPQSGPFLATGLFLIGFALFVYFVASRKVEDKSMVRLIIFLDTLWVVASLIIVVAQLFYLSLWGYILIAGVAAWVGLMAYLQYVGLRKIPGF